MAYTPKTDWASGNSVTAADINRWETGIEDADNRLSTLESAPPSSGSGLNWINVKTDHGAVGDGTTDDTAAFAAAFSAAAGAHKNIYIPPGTYIVSNLNPVTLSSSAKVRVVGGTGGRVVLKMPTIAAGAAADLIRFTYATTVTFENIEFYGPASYGDDTAVASIIHAYGNTIYAKFIHCSFFGATYSLKGDNDAGSNVTFDLIDCDITGRGISTSTTRSSMGVQVAVGELRMRDCSIGGVGKLADGHSHGIYVYQEVNLDLERVLFKDGVGEGYGVHIYGGTAAASRPRRIKGCIFDFTTADSNGKYMRGVLGPSAGTVIISDSTFTGKSRDVEGQAGGTIEIVDCALPAGAAGDYRITVQGTIRAKDSKFAGATYNDFIMYDNSTLDLDGCLFDGDAGAGHIDNTGANSVLKVRNTEFGPNGTSASSCIKFNNAAIDAWIVNNVFRVPGDALDFRTSIVFTGKLRVHGNVFGQTGRPVKNIAAGNTTIIFDPIIDAYRSFSVRADGTDQATKLQQALDVAAMMGGAIVQLPAGTIIVGTTLNIDSHVDLRGIGTGATILKLKDAANTNLLQTKSFATLTGTTNAAAPYHFAIRDLMLDGNKANNASGGRALQIYGAEFRLDNLLIRNAKSDGLYMEFGADVATGSENMFCESWASNIKVMDCGGNGVWANGVHDSMFSFIVSARNGAGGGAGTANFRLEGKSNNWINCHAWESLSDYGFRIRGRENLVMCQSEGALSAQFYIEWHDAHLVSPHAFYPAASARGILIDNSGAAVQRTIIEDAHLYQAGPNVFAPAIQFGNVGAGTRISANIEQASGVAYSGTIPADADIDIQVYGGAGQPSLFQKPGGIIKGAPAISDTFPTADATTPVAKNWTLTKGTAAAATVINGQRAKLTTGATGGYSVNDNTYMYGALPAMADGEILAKVEFAEVNVESYLMAVLRGDSDNVVSGTGYALLIQTGAGGTWVQPQLNRYSAGSRTTLYTATQQTLSAGGKLWLRFRVKGNLLAFKTWVDGTAEPQAWTYSSADGTPLATGTRSGFALTGGSAAAASTRYLHRAEITPL